MEFITKCLHWNALTEEDRKTTSQIPELRKTFNIYDDALKARYSYFYQTGTQTQQNRAYLITESCCLIYFITHSLNPSIQVTQSSPLPSSTGPQPCAILILRQSRSVSFKPCANTHTHCFTPVLRHAGPAPPHPNSVAAAAFRTSCEVPHPHPFFTLPEIILPVFVRRVDCWGEAGSYRCLCPLLPAPCSLSPLSYSIDCFLIRPFK